MLFTGHTLPRMPDTVRKTAPTSQSSCGAPCARRRRDQPPARDRRDRGQTLDDRRDNPIRSRCAAAAHRKPLGPLRHCTHSCSRCHRAVTHSKELVGPRRREQQPSRRVQLQVRPRRKGDLPQNRRAAILYEQKNLLCKSRAGGRQRVQLSVSVAIGSYRPRPDTGLPISLAVTRHSRVHLSHRLRARKANMEPAVCNRQLRIRHVGTVQRPAPGGTTRQANFGDHTLGDFSHKTAVGADSRGSAAPADAFTFS